jgi:hypothetical protein
VVGVLALGTVVAFGMYYIQHHDSARVTAAKSRPTLSQGHSSMTPSPPANSPAPQSAPPPAVAPSPAQPPVVTLSNQDNGRSITISVGTIITTQLAQQAGVAGYHWNGQARSYSTKQLYGVKQFGSSYALVHGADGSIRESHQIGAAGDLVLGYSDIANCSPGCNSQPIQMWQVNIHVP